MYIYQDQILDPFFDSLKDFTYEISENDIINNTCVGNNIGMNNPMYGVSHTEESKTLMSDKRIEFLKNNPDFIEQMRIWNSRPMSEDQKLKLSILKTGTFHTEETKALMSSQRVGKIPSESTILAARLANTGKKRPTVTCPHCDKSGGVGSMHQHHFDKCKFKTA
jgi:hypothetical protein